MASQMFAKQRVCRIPSLEIALDINHMRCPDDFIDRMSAELERSFQAMDALEAGAIANPDENRMVGHYWLRAPELAPEPEIAAQIRETQAEIKAFTDAVHRGLIRPPTAQRFTCVLLLGIGGSALGPMFIADALAQPTRDRMKMYFIDNTDPDGIERTLATLSPRLAETLCIVTSKSGGTPETRNGMLLVSDAYQAADLEFAQHAIAITMPESELDRRAKSEGWLKRFPMFDWIGGRTSVLSAVGLLPAALQGFDIDALLSGAADCDRATRCHDVQKNPAALMALMWHHATEGRGRKDMVVLPYKDRLLLISRYLQQLVMESLGKQFDLNGQLVEQGLTVYGNKGSTDQHAYIQQLRDGIPNFFAVFIRVLESGGSAHEVEPGITAGDYLHGFLLGTRSAFFDNGRQSMTITVPRIDARSVGALIALFERTVGLYATLIGVNAYHQPGVEAGKKAAASVLALQRKVVAALSATSSTASEIAERIGAADQSDTVYALLEHLVANGRAKSNLSEDELQATFVSSPQPAHRPTPGNPPSTPALDRVAAPVGPSISAVLADVDGTLLTNDKRLTTRTIRAVKDLRDRGIVFTITSSRPPLGLRMLVESLGLTMPMAAFNGGVIVLPDLSVLDERQLPDYLLSPLIDMLEAYELDVWLFRSTEWFVRSRTAPRVDHEASNIQLAPTVVPTFDNLLIGIVKILGVSEDRERVSHCEKAVQEAFGTQVSATRSHPFYLDVTHPSANKGTVIERLSRYLKIPMQNIATLGDQQNDVLMFKKSGLSIAMGNASDDVKRQANHVTASCCEEGFAHAVEKFILPVAKAATGAAVRATGQLHRLGQSLWLDNITRDLLTSGLLQHYIDEFSVTGLTSNPSIFERAIKNSSAYNDSIECRLARGTSPEEVFFAIALEDLGQAAKLFQPTFQQSNGVDGWVSLEVSPLLAHDTAGTLAAAKALFFSADCPNLMVKIPGTAEGLPAIEEAIFAGIPINVTLLFSREQYLAAAEAFLRGIERRIDVGLNPNIASVASVFVSRWDGVVADQVPAELQWRLGIAMARRTYKAYRSLLSSPRWQRIYNAGGRPQRLLWASTGMKDPALSDVTYIKALAAPFTVNTMPEGTLIALADHGDISTLLRADGGDCEEVLAEFARHDIDVYTIANRLQEDGAKSFVKSWNELLSVIASTTPKVAEVT